MVQSKLRCTTTSDKGASAAELIIVVTMLGVLTAITVPQMIAQRRVMRSSGVSREIMTQLRYARQLAISQAGATSIGALSRVAYTFQYDNSTKEMRVIGPIPAGTAALVDPTYPNNLGSSVVVRLPLGQGGLHSSEISYGIPSTSELPPGAPTIPAAPLGDGVSDSGLSNERINITFQPDGSVRNAANLFLDRALFIYNNRAPQATASAISVLGASGRVKVWRYSRSVNAYSY